MTIRAATAADLETIVDAIVDAERSGTDQSVYERLFDLSAAEFRDLLRRVLELGDDDDPGGHELSWRSFVVLEEEGVVLGACAAWVEAADGLPSALVKAQLLAHALGAERFRAAAPRLRALATLDLPRTASRIEIESIHVPAATRRRGLGRRLVEGAIAAVARAHPDADTVEILSAEGNLSSTRLFESLGFRVAGRREATTPELRALFPGTARLLWERGVGQDQLGENPTLFP